MPQSPRVPQARCSCASLVFVVLAISFLAAFASLVNANATISSTLTAPQRFHLEQLLKTATLTRWQRASITELLDPSATRRTHAASLGAASADGEWSDMLPEGVSSHSAIYDPVRDRMLVFGGYVDYPTNDVWALSFTGPVPWERLAPAGTIPPPSAGHEAIYDPIRDRMIVLNACGCNELWVLSLSSTPTWSQLATTGTPPSAANGQSAVYDLSHDRIVVFGGVTGAYDAFFNDVWALSLSGTPTWSQLTPAGTLPAPRAFHSAVYESSSNRMIVFAGTDGNYPNLSDVWALSLSGAPGWTNLDAVGTPPEGRSFHSAIYDPTHDRMIAFGGTDDGIGHFNDCWALSLSGTPTWAQLTPGETPKGRRAPTAIYDPVRFNMVVFGGEDDVHAPDLNDVWTLALLGSPEWTPGPGNAPSVRAYHTAVIDRSFDRMLVFGGRGAGNEVWALSLSGSPVWSELSTAGTPPSPRLYHSAIYDPERKRMLVYGGDDNYVWSLSVSGSPTWSILPTAGEPPSILTGHTAIYDPVRDRMVIYGGTDVWQLLLDDTPTWQHLIPNGMPPPARTRHSAIYDPLRDRMIVFGGAGTFPYFNDVWSLNFGAGSEEWTQLIPTGATFPDGRFGHSAVYDPVRDRMLILGGWDGYNGSFALSLSGAPTWAPLNSDGYAWYLEGEAAVFDAARDRVVAFGGADFYREFSETRQLVWGTATAVQPHTRHFADALQPCYPNPFNPRVTIPFELHADGNATLSIFDVSGRLVKTLVAEWTPRGTHSAIWDGKSNAGVDVSSGVYFCRLSAGAFLQTRKIVMIK